MIKCEIIKTKEKIDGEVKYVYGLEFYKSDEIKPFRKIKDIYAEENMIHHLKELLNDNDVDENQIDYIIEDNL